MFPVTAKRMDFPEIDFWNWFSPDSNAALMSTFHSSEFYVCLIFNEINAYANN